MKRMVVTASSALKKLPGGYDEWYIPQSLDDLAEEMGSEGAKEYEEEQKEMLKAYDAELIGYGVAKEEYYDALSENGLEYVVVMKESNGRENVGFFIHDRFYPADVNEIMRCIEDYF